jgi:hypothetical protein
LKALLEKVDASVVKIMPVLVRVQQLQRLLLLEEHRDTFATAWNWVDAYLRCVHGADADVYRMLRGAMRARRALLLLDGMDEGGRMRTAIERHVTEVLAPQGHVLLVTSRPDGLDKTCFQEHFLALELRPLDETQQHIVVERRVGKALGEALWREIAATAPRDEHNELVTSNPLVFSQQQQRFSGAEQSRLSPRSASPTGVTSRVTVLCLTNGERDGLRGGQRGLFRGTRAREQAGAHSRIATQPSATRAVRWHRVTLPSALFCARTSSACARSSTAASTSRCRSLSSTSSSRGCGTRCCMRPECIPTLSRA